MISFSSCPAFWQGFFGLWTLLLLWSSIALCFYTFRKKKSYLFSAILVSLFLYLLLQTITATISGHTHKAWLAAFVQSVGTLPVLVMLLLNLSVTLLLLLFFRKIRKRMQSQLTDMSVKYAIDTLPVGLCYYENNGFIRLKNESCDTIYRKMTGLPLQNGAEFAARLMSGSPGPGCEITKIGERKLLLLPEGTAYSFSFDPIPGSENQVTLLSLIDISEEYEKTQRLFAGQKTVRELNEKLTTYNQQILSVISARERLNARVRIHDELGLLLLRTRNYLQNGGTEEEYHIILDKQKQIVQYLRHEEDEAVSDEYQLLLETARKLNINVSVTGEMPVAEGPRHIIVIALHESLTNTLRHAHGDSLSMDIAEHEDGLQVTITNNGTMPAEEITETGGLKSLRTLIEQAGGSMNISINELFQLTITLPKEVTTHEI